ncbi:MAG: hypothetical protein WBX25_02200 [Rhodomicrobium sp.]
MSEKNFKLCLDTFDSGEQGNLGPWFGWFSNRLEGYADTLKLQRQGITFDRLLDIYSLHGHNIRQALSSP